MQLVSSLLLEHKVLEIKRWEIKLSDKQKPGHAGQFGFHLIGDGWGGKFEQHPI